MRERTYDRHTKCRKTLRSAHTHRRENFFTWKFCDALKRRRDALRHDVAPHCTVSFYPCSNCWFHANLGSVQQRRLFWTICGVNRMEGDKNTDDKKRTKTKLNACDWGNFVNTFAKSMRNRTWGIRCTWCSCGEMQPSFQTIVGVFSIVLE